MRIIRLFIFFALLLSTAGYSQVFDWEWQHPNPVGNNLNDVTILPNGNYVAVGDFGVVLRSTNSGTDWSVSYVDGSNGNRSIYEATFLDNSLGFACGLDGLILKTTDGGASWSHLTSGTTNDLWYIEMIDADTGYVCGSATTLLKTTDGGSTWNPIVVSGTSTTLYKVHFVNPSTGFIGTASSTVGRLLKTTDYGATWTSLPGYTATGTVRGIFFFDADTGWVSNSLYQILKTTDGGTSFTEQADFGTGTIYEVKFWDAATGVAAGAAGDVFFTTDGGTNWSTSNVGIGYNIYALGIAGFLGAESAGLNDVVVAGEGGGISFSGTFGSSWNQLADLVTVEVLREVRFVNGNTGYAVGGSTSFSDLLKSTDGGVTWSKLPFDAGYRLYSQYWVDENVGYVGRRGPDGIFKTTDGGVNWDTLNPGAASSTGLWYEISFFDADTGYASGSSGVVVKTTDGGASWTQLDPGFGTSVVYDMWMFDSQNLLVAGSSGKISKSTDGGATFSLLTTPFSTTLYSVHFADANTGYVCGTSGNVYKTTDGGTTWSTLVTPGTSTLYKIIFDDFGNGWVCGSAGAVWYTVDEGANWFIADKFPSTALMYTMTMADSRLWIGGTLGNILRGFADPTVPVEMVSFTANVSGNNVTLNWQTATETNNMGFEIQRRTENEFESIGFVPGFGTSAQPQSYTYSDEVPESGIITYRLKQIDNDGSYEYSDEIEVEIGIPGEFRLSQNYPNPFNPATVISYQIPVTGNVSLKLYDVLGREVRTLVNEVKNTGTYEIQVEGNGLASGVYYYQLKSGTFSETKKMILMK